MDRAWRRRHFGRGPRPVETPALVRKAERGIYKKKQKTKNCAHTTEGRADQTEAGESQAEPGGERPRALSHQSQLGLVTGKWAAAVSSGRGPLRRRE